MGCDIHCYAEKKIDGDYVAVNTSYDWFGSRRYGLFGWLANVRNYSGVIPLGQTEVPVQYQRVNRGIPTDVSDDVHEEWETWEPDAHNPSWLSIAELRAFDYSQMMEDRRVTRNNDGGCTCNPGEGSKMTYREFLPDSFFRDLDEAESLGVERIVFWFDN